METKYAINYKTETKRHQLIITLTFSLQIPLNDDDTF